jgi:hypothetical protein
MPIRPIGACAFALLCLLFAVASPGVASAQPESGQPPRTGAEASDRDDHNKETDDQQKPADEDPAAGLLNLFDVWIAFAVALLLAMVSYMSVPELMNANSDVTVIKNPGGADMEIIQKKGVKIDRYRATSERLAGEGQKLGRRTGSFQVTSSTCRTIPRPRPNHNHRYAQPSAIAAPSKSLVVSPPSLCVE